jgi:hypothetical protein
MDKNKFIDWQAENWKELVDAFLVNNENFHQFCEEEYNDYIRGDI